MTNTVKIRLLVMALMLIAPALMQPGSKADTKHTATAADLARAAVSDLGGGKFRDLKSIRLAGVASALSPLNPNVQPAEFQLLSTNTGIRIDLTMSFGLIQMINDGQRFYNLVNGNAANFGIAPPGKFGLRVLAKYDQPGYKITPLPEHSKELGFRITDPENNATDFHVHKETGRVTRFIYKFSDFDQTWELDNFKAVEGVMVPHMINIRLATRQGDFQMLLRAADAKINQPVSDNAFAPKGR
jgi:hypothetical protein